MGVPELWRILESTLQRRPSSDLHGVRVAIDGNLWIQHALRTQAPLSPESIIVAVLLRRLLRMLGAGILPIFVFDGPAPAVKRRVIERRKSRHAMVADEVRTLARRIVAARLAQVNADASSPDGTHSPGQEEEEEELFSPPSPSASSSTDIDEVPQVADTHCMPFQDQRRLLRKAQKRLYADRWERSMDIVAAATAHQLRSTVSEEETDEGPPPALGAALGAGEAAEEQQGSSHSGLSYFSSMQLDGFLSHAALKVQVEELRTAVSRSYRKTIAMDGASLCRSEAGVDVRKLQPIRSDASGDVRRFYYLGPRKLRSRTGGSKAASNSAVPRSEAGSPQRPRSSLLREPPLTPRMEGEDEGMALTDRGVLSPPRPPSVGSCHPTELETEGGEVQGRSPVPKR
eukprot:Hpha_TRINITY_DN16007_c5_g3::TRINITY_DN16007_c5_g3_i1::g.117675::m.117675